MWWVVIVVVLGVAAFFEWRSRKKPLPPGLSEHIGTHNAAHDHLRPLTGGHDVDGKPS